MSSALSSARRTSWHRRPVQADEEGTSLLLPDPIGEGRCAAIAAEPQLSSPRSDRKRRRRLPRPHPPSRWRRAGPDRTTVNTGHYGGGWRRRVVGESNRYGAPGKCRTVGADAPLHGELARQDGLGARRRPLLC